MLAAGRGLCCGGNGSLAAGEAGLVRGASETAAGEAGLVEPEAVGAHAGSHGDEPGQPCAPAACGAAAGAPGSASGPAAREEQGPGRLQGLFKAQASLRECLRKEVRRQGWPEEWVEAAMRTLDNDALFNSACVPRVANVGGYWLEAMRTVVRGKRLKGLEKRTEQEQLEGLVVFQQSKSIVPANHRYSPKHEHCMRLDPRRCQKGEEGLGLLVAWLVRVPVTQEEVDSPSTGVWIHEDGTVCFAVLVLHELPQGMLKDPPRVQGRAEKRGEAFTPGEWEALLLAAQGPGTVQGREVQEELGVRQEAWRLCEQWWETGKQERALQLAAEATEKSKPRAGEGGGASKKKMLVCQSPSPRTHFSPAQPGFRSANPGLFQCFTDPSPPLPPLAGCSSLSEWSQEKDEGGDGAGAAVRCRRS